MDLPPGLEYAVQTAWETFAKMMEMQTREVNLHFNEPETMARLNEQYRGKAKPTDVLSFAYGGEDHLFGELAICLAVAEAQAMDHDWDVTTEVIRLLAHGFAHLMGHDHETDAEEAEMLTLEKELLAVAGFKNIYPDA